MTTIGTQARAEASRRNGRGSRGPLTFGGKERSSRNSLRHGILAENVCAGDTPEQREAFAEMLNQLRVELMPASTLEALLIERIGAALSRTRRVIDFEAGAALEHDNTPEPHLVGLSGRRSFGTGCSCRSGRPSWLGERPGLSVVLTTACASAKPTGW
jgi:hypothetical protein